MVRIGLWLFAVAVWILWCGAASASAPIVPLSDVPLTLSKGSEPQVLFLVTNSESMDGTTGGAIMVGAKGCYTPTGGFVPPYGMSGAYKSGYTPTADCPGGQAAYTVKDSNGTEYDNSESRLSVAKGGILQILQDYKGAMEFGLMDFAHGAPAYGGGHDPVSTWVYYMGFGQPSDPNFAGPDFVFSNTPAGNSPTTSVAGDSSSPNTYPNPCYGKTSNPDCNAFASSGYFSGNPFTDQYLEASISSDASSVNDVFYVPDYYGYPDIYFTFDGPYGPYAPVPDRPRFLADYNAGRVFVGYCGIELYGGFYDQGRGCPKYSSTSTINDFYAGGAPTNAGYIPDTPGVLYAKRGFGYVDNNDIDVGGVSGSAGNLLEPVAPYSSSHYANLDALLKPETNDDSTGEIKSRVVQSPIAGELYSAQLYYQGKYKDYPAPASSNASCSAYRFAVLVTDGLPTEDLGGKSWPPIGSAVGNGYGLTATFHSDGSLASTNDQALQDTIDKLKDLYRAGVETYVIGLGAGVDTSVNPMAAKVLTAMAMAGSNDKNSTYFAANNAATLSGDLHQIIGMIEAQALSTSSAAVNSTSIRTDSTAYQARFTPSTSPYGDWTGNLYAFPITSNGSVNTAPGAALWNAKSLLDAKNWNTGRVIATWNPSAAGGAGAGTPLRWADLSAAQQADLETSSSDTLGPARLDYLRGDTSREQRNGGPFRNRSHILGDIVDSAPLWVGPPSGPYPDASYQTFKTAEASRPAVVYVGANDSMLHAFDATSGVERFAYVPNGVFPDLMALTSPSYNLNHLFYVDGSPTAGDVEFSDGSWHTILVGGLNHGGKSVYALDITNPSSDGTESGLASNVLWEFTNPDLGYSYGQPQIARIPWGSSGGTRFVVVFGSGFNNATQTPDLFVVDPQTGALIKEIDLCAGQPASVCNPSASNGTVGAAMVYPGTDGTATAAYAGDLQGNVWKVDFSSGNPHTWSVTLLFKAEDSSGTPQPITTTPVVSRHPLYPAKPGYMVYFGTGRLLGQADLTTTQTQSVYGIWDNGVTYPVPKSKLVQQTVTQTTLSSGTVVRFVSDNPIDWNTKLGWYFDLPAARERLVTEPRLSNGTLLFTTYAPDPTSCSGGGESWLMAVDYASGGALTRPAIDINGDHKITSADLVGGKVPAGISLGKQYAAAPTILATPNHGNIGDVKLISESSGNIQSVSDAKSGWQGRWSWKQLY